MKKEFKRDVKTVDCRKNYSELLNIPYAYVKMFLKDYIENVFGFNVLYTIVRLLRSRKCSERYSILKALYGVYGEKSIRAVNDSNIIAGSKKSMKICVDKLKDSIKITQHFPSSERCILKKSCKNGDYKILSYPMQVGGYVGWNRKILIAIIPIACYYSKEDVQFLIDDIFQNCNLDNKDFGKTLVKDLFKEYSCSLEMVIIDKKNLDVYTTHYDAVSKREDKPMKIEPDTDESNGAPISNITTVVLGDDNADKFYDDKFEIEFKN